jgi:hypothetical protein
MVRLIILTACFLVTARDRCQHHEAANGIPGCFRGRLEVKGGCMNYTISMLGRFIDTSLVEKKWTNANTGRIYQNVFALKSRCTFPTTIAQGDEFYFTIDSTTVQNCAVCLMYYPVPRKKLSIKVLPGPCNQ